MSNIRDEVTSRLSVLTVNPHSLAYLLAGKQHNRFNLWQEIHTLREEQVLTISSSGMQLMQGSGRRWTSSGEAEPSQPRFFIDVLEASFDRTLENRLAGQSVAFEISGGLDSSTLPLYISKKNPAAPLLAAVMIYPGAYQESQLQKIAELQKTANIEIVQELLRVGVNHPLVRIMHSRTDQASLVHPTLLELYHEPTKNLALHLAARGVDTVITGIGGDELFEHILSSDRQLQYGESVRKEYLADLPPYVTEYYALKLAQSIPDQPTDNLPALPLTLHGANIGRNNTYIEENIWPISQFSDPALYEFCQGLPIQFRANKNILRAYYQAQQFPEAIFNAPVNEDFEDFFIQSFYEKTYTNLITDLIEKSITAKVGYVDAAKLRELYDRSITNKDSEWLFHFYCWMCAEIDLQSYIRKTMLL